MDAPEIHCKQTCRQLCTGIELAMTYEKRAILQYASIRNVCTEPEVKNMLNALIIQKQKSIELLERTQALLRSKFEVLDQIRDGFEMQT